MKTIFIFYETPLVKMLTYKQLSDVTKNLNACSYLKDTKLSFLAMAVPVRLIVYGMMVFQEVTSYHLS